MSTDVSNQSEQTSNRYINLVALIDGGHHYTGRVRALEGLVNDLKNLGYNVDFYIEVQQNNRGEFFIYKVMDDGRRKIIFANDQDTAEGESIFAESVTDSNKKQIIDYIINA